MTSLKSTPAELPEANPVTTGDRSSSGRLLGIDGLRFGAAAAVVLYHFTAGSTAASYWGADPAQVFPVLNEITRYGWLAVELFFMISGFVILLSADGRGVAAFVASRVGRLFPAYWACIALTVGLQQVWSGGRQTNLTETLANLTMVQDLFAVTGVQVVFWTLLVELKFYLLVVLLLAFGPPTRNRVLALATIWPLAGWAAQESGTPWLADLLVANYAPYFAVGMLLFLVYRDGWELVSGVLLAGGVTLCVKRVLEAADRAADMQGVSVSPALAVTIMLTSMIAVWATTIPGRGAPRRRVAAVLGTGGALTYPIYLVHTQFGYAVIDTLAPETTRTVALLAAGALSLVLAVGIHYGVERPASARLRRAVRAGLLRGGEVVRSYVSKPADTPAVRTS